MNNKSKPVRPFTITEIDTLEQNHLVPTKWGQRFPWNIYAPYTDSTCTNHCRTGCTVVAAAQMLYYFHTHIATPRNTYGYFYSNAYIPSTSSYIVLQNSDVHYDQSTWGNHWMSMPTDSSQSNTALVASLMTFIGYKIGAKYHQTSTGASLLSVKNFIYQEYMYSSYMTEDTTEYVSVIEHQIMNRGVPIIAQITINGGEGGHAVLIDGYRKETTTTYYYAWQYTGLNSMGLPTFEPILYDTEVSTQRFVAINWGWFGTGDTNNQGDTIWYNLDFTAGNWYSYNTLKRLLYGFATENK